MRSCLPVAIIAVSTTPTALLSVEKCPEVKSLNECAPYSGLRELRASASTMLQSMASVAEMIVVVVVVRK